jgi:hypothetical protein
MKKSYSSFTIEDIENLGLSVINGDLFDNFSRVEPSELLLKILESYQGLPLQSEKAKSEFLISPIISEVRLRNPKKMTFFSGYQFNVDEKLGLKGFCDFLISRKYNAVFVESPLLAVVESKHNQDLLDATPQCIAEMYAAQLFNERKGEKQSVIFGNITNGYEWLFLKLEDKLVTIDTERFSATNLPKLLGAWQMIIDSFSD